MAQALVPLCCHVAHSLMLCKSIIHNPREVCAGGSLREVIRRMLGYVGELEIYRVETLQGF